MISQTVRAASPKLSSPSAAKAETVLTTDQLVKIYGGRAVVDGVNMHVGAGEIVAINCCTSLALSGSRKIRRSH